MHDFNKINRDISLQGVSSFQQTGIDSFLIQCLSKCGFTRPTPIQYHSINSFSNFPAHNIIAHSKSGTGKTLAFLVPILNSICKTKDFTKQTISLIILPTRELSIQVHQYLKQLINVSSEVKVRPEEKEFKMVLKGLSSLLTIGGIPIEDDKKTLITTGANFIIGTVGRVYQLFQSGYLKPDHLKFVIFDEGDKLFASKDQKLDKILKRIHIMLQSKKQNQQKDFRFLVFSATYEEQSIKKITEIITRTLKTQESKEPQFLYIQTLANSITNEFAQKVTENWRELNFVKFSFKKQDNQNNLNQNNEQKQINSNTSLINLENIKKFWIEIENTKSSFLVRKCNTLKQVLSELSFKKCLIFVQKKALLEQIYDQLKQFQPLLIHGSLSQASRIKAMNQANKSRIIISSDLLARGIDLVLDLVVLYDAQINETFWHRIGRTGRFGRVGVAVSLDKIQDWKPYDAQEINQILKEAWIEEGGLRKNEWYGTYMTQYGKWEEISAEKQQIINENYKFFEQNPQNLIDQECLSKKLKKQMKQAEKNIQKQSIQSEQKQQTLQTYPPKTQIIPAIKTQFRSQKEFLSYYNQIFSCKKCYNHLIQVSRLTTCEFDTKKYFQKQLNSEP